LRHYQDEIFRRGKGALEEGTQQISRGFGNATGLIEYRKGKLFNQPEWVSFVLDRLEPGDILLEKTPFRTFIHDGRVAGDIQTRLSGEALYSQLLGSRYATLPP
jgi:hypothetical protein